MATVLLWVSAGLLGVLILLGVTFVVGMRVRSPLVINAVRRLARATRTFPLKSAGHGDSYASVVMHVGRSSGRRYQTPVRTVLTDDGVVIALPYGSNSDWVRNVLAHGSARIVHQDREYELDNPRVAPLPEVERWFTRKDQRTHRLFGVTEALVAHRQDGGADELPQLLDERRREDRRKSWRT